MKVSGRILLAGSLVLASAAAKAQDFANASIVTESIGGDLYVLFGQGENVIAGNMLVSIGADGVLVVDDMVEGIVPKYRAAIAELGGGEISFAINTHWHFDHSGGNPALGPGGAWFVAHENSRAMLLRNNVINLVSQTIDQPAFSGKALPVVTYDTAMRMHFNGHRIELLHPGPAHTTGDTAVILPERNVAHLGDVFNTGGYPFIDADNGGSLQGVIDFCEAVLAELDPGAVVIPGHGPVSSYDGLADYILMLKTIRDRMSTLIRSGASLEQVVNARLTSDWDATKGDPTMLLDRAYASMTRR